MGNIFSTQFSISCDAAIDRCQNCTINRATYISDLKENLDTLETELQKLRAVQSDVMRRVTISEQQHERRTEQVQEWLSRVQEMEAQVGELQKVKHQHIEKLCLGGYCSKSCRSSYRFGKQVAKKLKNVTALKKERGDFQEVAERVPDDPADEVPIDQPKIVGQESLFDGVWRCLQEKEVEIVGLYGPGGVGKTTLLKQINNKFCHEPHEFDYIIWVVVSKGVNYEKIQEEIGKKIGLFTDPWKNNSLEDKAKDIFKILSRKKFVLLLDDIWERIDLSKIGVPLPSLKNESKIVLTTRDQNVCGRMKVKKSIRVEILRAEEAWELFKENLQEDTICSHPDILQLAKSVAKECGGIPLVLIVIGRAMACKDTPQEWQDALQVLQRCIFAVPDMCEVYPRLKFSYDNLPDEKIRSCFLYCCLFPEDYRIDKDELIEYWMGEGFLDEYSEGYSIIGDLVRACLLEKGEHESVKMHDVIRDMAMWIANEIEKGRFSVHANAKLTEPPVVEKWGDVRRMSLMYNKIKNLSQVPTCPDLSTLFLGRNFSLEIASDFFQFMPSLKVLDLSENVRFTTLPSGFSKLVSLQCLNLSRTRIEELPKELKELVNLICLNLDFTEWLHTVPRQLIYSFSKLQVLRMLGCGKSKGAAEDCIFYGDGEVLIAELRCLNHLSRLTISLSSSRAFQGLLGSRNLHSCIQSLDLHNIDGAMSLHVSSLATMKHLQSLELSQLDLDKLEIDYGMGIPRLREIYGLNSLRSVYVRQCSNLREVTWLVFAPCLVFLSISYCNDMEEVINPGKMGEAYKDMIGDLKPFAKLEKLCLWVLPNLKSIFREALPFSHMKKMSIQSCSKLNSLPLDSNCSNRFQISGEKYWWKKLQWNNEATLNAFLPFFKRE